MTYESPQEQAEERLHAAVKLISLGQPPGPIIFLINEALKILGLVQATPEVDPYPDEPPGVL